MRIVHAMALVALVAGGGCKSATQKQFDAEAAMVPTPLELDPVDHIELAQWWASETHLLRLDENAAYSLHEGLNRFSRPIERGRWAQQSYAMLWLEPYNTIRVDPRRVSITKIEGEVALILPKIKPMFALPDGPPQVLEDRLIGQWSGAIGTLQLQENLRYTLTPTPNVAVADEVPNIYAIRKGTWRIVDDRIVLEPDITGIDPVRLPLTIDDNQVTISAPGGALQKSQMQAAATTTEHEPAK